MSDFNESRDGPKRWISYYGKFAHQDVNCPVLNEGNTMRQTNTDRPECDLCGN